MEAEDVRSSFIATTVHLQEGPERSARDRDAAQAAAQAAAADLRDAKPANTKQAYEMSMAAIPGMGR